MMTDGLVMTVASVMQDGQVMTAAAVMLEAQVVNGVSVMLISPVVVGHRNLKSAPGVDKGWFVERDPVAVKRDLSLWRDVGYPWRLIPARPGHRAQACGHAGPGASGTAC